MTASATDDNASAEHRIRELTKELSHASGELAEAREQQAATAEILRVISSSPMDSQRVFAEIAASAGRLCDASDAAIHQVDGEVLRLVASHGSIPKGDDTLPLTREVVTGRAVIDRQTIQVADAQAETGEYPVGSANARRLGHRTLLAVPLMRSGQAIGVIGIRRTEVRPFSDRQIELLKTFADQAVIAIENTRLFEAEQTRTRELTERTQELTETLEYQTATSDVLGIISRSPNELQPVFDGIVETAQRLCETYDASIVLRDGERLKLKAHVGPISMRAELPLGNRGLVVSRSVMDRKTVHVHDLAAVEGEFPDGREDALKAGHRSILAVPLVHKGEGIGALIVRRFEVRPFSDRQIGLLATFADQAVIAIENARLFEAEQASKRELSEALEQQTATTRVLTVIGSSQGELRPVFHAILQDGVRICEAKFGVLLKYHSDAFHPTAWVGVPTNYEQFLRQRGSFQPQPGAPLDRLLRTKNLIHSIDELAENSPSPAAKHGGARSLLAVPMLKDTLLVGAIVIYRTEVRPFTDKQIELVSSFAKQAVIAIENARLLNELRESLQQQTATADVLKVISRATFDLPRVLDTLVRSAASLCDSYDTAIWQKDGDVLRIVSNLTHIPSIGRGGTVPLTRGSAAGRAVHDRQTIHLADVQSERHEYPESSANARRLGYHTILAVPLVGAGEAVGAIALRRTEVRPFTDRQIELLQTFADQAVIAIENTRLFEEVQARTRELTENLEYQTATSEVLNVISRSPSQVQPVLDAIAGTAARLCSAEYAFIGKAVDSKIHLAAASSMDSEHARWLQQHPVSIDRSSATGRTALERRAIHIPDILADPEFAHHDWQNVGRQRTILGVPLLHEGNLVGVIMLVRNMVRPFTQRQIELVTTFADQAVIAINNVRLFEEVQARTKELQESLDRQTATSEVLGVISRSPNEVQPVLDTIVATAQRLCQAERAAVWRLAGETFRAVAHRGQPEERVESVLSARMPLSRGSMLGRATLARRAVQVEDVATDTELVASHALNRAGNIHTVLAVPLLLKGHPIGGITLSRTRVAPFDDKQVALVESFADQAVIAIENSRLFEAEQASKRELQESLEYQTATSEVLNVISRSPTELKPVLDSIAATAARLCESVDAQVWRVQGRGLVMVAQHGTLKVAPTPLTRGTVTGRAVIDQKTIHVHDLAALVDTEYPDAKGPQAAVGHRTTLATPLVSRGESLGAILVRKMQVDPFSAKQIALLQTFADQAVIAIENARLFEAEQASKRELARSVEELESLGKVSQAVNSSLELNKVLPTILEHACAMSFAGGGTVYVFDKTTSEFRLAAAHNMSDEHIAMVRAQPMGLNSVVVGECATRREVVQVADLSSAAPSPLLDILLRTGVRAVLAVPLLHQAEVVGVLVVRRNQPGTFSPEVIRLVEAFAAQSAIAVENARLFGEIAQKSRELEIASQHKSQFVANMSHELRRPLAAILGYAELMQEGFYEPLGQKSLDALTRIRSNGKHLLGLINTVLDIAKIESGQFTLNMTEYAIESVVETVRSATESLAQNKKLLLKTDVARSLPIGLGDEQRLTQVLLNLVGNAIKFTDTGEVRVTAKAVNGQFNVSVVDTGPGIPEEHQARIFEQFHQVDSSNTKAKGGTGLGLAIAKQIVEMHGGRIWVESTLGKGSTFQMELPTRAELRRPAP